MKGKRTKLVNKILSKITLQEVLTYTRITLLQIMYAIVTALSLTDYLFAKADIKDSFWCIFVKNESW